MASRARRERCVWCGVQLVFSPEAQSVQCPTCGSVTRLRTRNPRISQASINQAAGVLRGFIGAVVAATPTNNNNNCVSAAPRPNGFYPSPQAALSVPSAHGRKRAVLCGVSYRGKKYMLKGSVNDVRSMRQLLVDRMGFPSDSVLTLTEEDMNPQRIPTRNNIMAALRWLVQGSSAGDSLVFHYSGHGSKQKDTNMDEIDGYDESICPVDHEWSGKILDDHINATIVKPLPRNATLHAIMDTCYSGTLLDLPFFCRMNKEQYYKWEDHRIPTATYKGTKGGRAISIGACDDHETSADTSAFSGDANSMTGALTYSFIQAMQKEASPTYGGLLNSMRTTIRQAQSGVRVNNAPVASQEPQLSSSDMFDINSTRVTL